MKTKSIILIITVCAAITLSFTFGTSKSSKVEVKKDVASKSVDSEPAGGFISEDKF